MSTASQGDTDQDSLNQLSARVSSVLLAHLLLSSSRVFFVLLRRDVFFIKVKVNHTWCFVFASRPAQRGQAGGYIGRITAPDGATRHRTVHPSDGPMDPPPPPCSSLAVSVVFGGCGRDESSNHLETHTRGMGPHDAGSALEVGFDLAEEVAAQ